MVAPMKKKKVLHVFGGIRAYKMCRSLAGAGWDVHKITIQDPEPFKEYWDNPGITLHQNEKVMSWYAKLRKKQFGPFKSYLPLYFFFPKYLNKVVRENDIKLIHANRHTGAALVFATRKRYNWPKDVKIIFDYHDPWSGEEVPNPGFILRQALKIFYKIEKSIVENSDTVITQGEEHDELLMKRYGLPKEHFSPIWNPQNIKIFKPYTRQRKKMRKKYGLKDKDLVILFLGSVIDYFGLHLLPAAAKILREKVPNAKFAIRGVIRDAEYWETVKSQMKELGVDDMFVEIPRLSAEEMPIFISACDVGVITHMRGSLICETAIPNKIFEYMACGLPVVTSDLSNLTRFIIPYKAGVQFKANDAKSLAKAFEKILLDKKLRKKMSKAARKNSVKRFNWQIETNKLMKTYEDVLNSK